MKMQFVIVVSLLLTNMPPPSVAAFPRNVELVTDGLPSSLSHPAPLIAVLSINVQSVTVGEELTKLNIPPPPPPGAGGKRKGKGPPPPPPPPEGGSRKGGKRDKDGKTDGGKPRPPKPPPPGGGKGGGKGGRK